jgi:glucose-6-phosphate isomerase
MGTYLHGFQEGLSAALRSKGRQVINITIEEVNEYNLGMIIALYERAVAVYAEFVNINAFHQPGVQAYKLAAQGVLDLREKFASALAELDEFSGNAADFAAKTNLADAEVEIAGLLAKAALNSEVINREYDAEKGWIYSLK